MNQSDKLAKEILYHKKLYYSGCPEISDFEYDKLEEMLRKLDPDHYALSIVGDLVDRKEKIPHEKKMLSLMKTYSFDELLNWVKDYDVLCTQKIDGVSCSLVYEKGKLSLAKTRGDGNYGESIKDQVYWMEEIPKKIAYQDRCEIRGEIYCPFDEFSLLAKNMEELNMDPPSSPRNIVAGLMGRKEKLFLCKYLRFFAFDFLGDSSIKTEYEKYGKLEKLLFKIPPIEMFKKEDLKNLQKWIFDLEEQLSSENYLIDGGVIVYNDLLLHHELGETSHHPRYKMAFKFQGEVGRTKIKEIQWNVSRNGILTPKAVVETVELSGAKISNVTLHNYGIVKNFHLKKGDEIEIIRSGEVIPKFQRVLKSSKNKMEIPSVCPSCEEKVTEEEIRLFCLNPQCPDKNFESILNYLQKIGIEDLSEKRLHELIQLKLVTSIPDLYRLEKDDFLKMTKVKETLAEKMYKSIEKSKKVSLANFLASLGIQGGGLSKCERIVLAGYNSIEKIFNLTTESLMKVDLFAEKSSEEFLKSLESKKTMIGELIQLGVSPFVVESKTNDFVAGKVFVITGTLSRKRSEIEKRIKELGGKTSSSVTTKTDFLICNDFDQSSSSKAKKARDLQTTVLSENELMDKLDN